MSQKTRRARAPSSKQQAGRKAADDRDAPTPRGLRKGRAGVAAPKAQAAAPRKRGAGRRIQVRRSGVHGKGVFAVAPIPKGARIIEYVGEIVTWPEALRRHPHDPSDPNHTFYFHVDDDHVIDAGVGGNAARWINHACQPNCKAEQEDDGRVFIDARRDIEPGEELFYDYGLVIDERYTPKLKKQYECRCGSRRCRGTMLAPKR
jgi:SET domain-containing protein